VPANGLHDSQGTPVVDSILSKLSRELNHEYSSEALSRIPYLAGKLMVVPAGVIVAKLCNISLFFAL
jgi:hypothetical protein